MSDPDLPAFRADSIGVMKFATPGFLCHRPVMETDFSIELQRSNGCRMQLPYRRWHCLTFYPSSASSVERVGAWGRQVGVVRAGEVGLYPAGEPEIIDWHGRTDALHLHLDPRRVGRERMALGLGEETGIARYFICNEAVLIELAASLYESVKAKAFEDVSLLVDQIARRLADAHPAKRPLPQPELGRVLLDDILDLMHGPAAARASVPKLANHAGLSLGRFIRKFSASFGTSPHDYLVRNRIETAKGLLSEGMQIAETATECGFCDQSHLTHAFRRRTGMTPAAFVDWANL